MLLTRKEWNKIRWLKWKDNEPGDYSGPHFVFVSDGTETAKDIKHMINWADTWSDIEGYQIVDNYNELKAALKRTQ